MPYGSINYAGLPTLSAGIAIAIIVGGIFPALVQRFQVQPSELARERPYIEYYIQYTGEAFGLNNIEEKPFPAEEAPTILYYRFIVRDGADEDFYEDDDLFDGGWGAAYDDSPDYSFQIDVYSPDFETPEWMHDAVVYQIFPDRFFNGDPKNDPDPSDPTVYENEVLPKAWDDQE